MSEITMAITAKQTQIKKLQSDIDALQRAASILGGTGARAKQKSQPKLKPKQKARSKPKQKRKPWSAAAKRAMAKKTKASWARRRKAKT